MVAPTTTQSESQMMETGIAGTTETTAPVDPHGAPSPGFFERLSVTRFNANMGLVCDIGIGVALVVAGFVVNAFGLPVASATFAAGLLVFSFVEYSFHRWLFHGRASSMREGHDKHHIDPLGYDALPFFIPPLLMLALAGLVAIVAPLSTALLLAGSVALGYASYGLAHTAIHAIRFRRALPKRWAASHHVHHHHPDSNFGVTTPLWDVVLGTRYVPVRARR
jgi:sterol desaturase/sphingolipid hydroxylase (fatty acid hydroxylase superfamily)